MQNFEDLIGNKIKEIFLKAAPARFGKTKQTILAEEETIPQILQPLTTHLCPILKVFRSSCNLRYLELASSVSGLLITGRF